MPPHPAEPSISVIIAAYQAERTLGAQLDALAAQRGSAALEVIVADNGSTDGTAEVVRRHQRSMPRLRLVDAAGRQGAPYARNLAAHEASGRWFLFTDADDVVSVEWVARMAAALEHAEVVAGGLDHESLNSGQAGVMPRTFVDELPVPYGFLPYANGNNIGLTREAFWAVGGYAEGANGWDIDFAWRLQLSGRQLHFVPEACVAYRYRSGSAAHLRQMISYGAAEPWLYRRFRIYGMRRRSARDVVGTWVYLIRLLGRPRTAAVRAEIRRVVGYALGRLQGSVRQRVLYL